MTTIERVAYRRAASTGAVVVAALLVAIASGGCSSGSSESASHLGSSTTSTPTVSAPAPEATGPRVIIDTDLSRWWDDATAIGLANVLQQQGAVNVLGVVSDVRNPVAVAAIDAIDTAYGHADIPLGAVAHSDADTAQHGYSDVARAATPAHRPQQRRRARGRRPLPSTAGATTGRQRHDRVPRGLHEPGRTHRLARRAQVGHREGQAAGDHGRSVPRRIGTGHESETRPRSRARRRRRPNRRGSVAHPDLVGRRARRDRHPGRRHPVRESAGEQPHAHRLPKLVRMWAGP